MTAPCGTPRGLGHNARVSDVRHVLVLPDRDSAEEVAELLAERYDLPEEPRLRRDALSGEDDAEDAQWLVLVTDEDGELDPGALDDLAADYGGWLEEDDDSDEEE
ncbi:hypothetical protein SAMN05216259_107293 [Actinacidiphila guanduensis]|uniref:Uncharacterized protein n=1 Tax=Actinacidiphila guanduensis TaxID=310781 RepID=A0A1H0GVC4_9ACTN|nr:hypothetical protein SAMN05216259_107293 [Actinacidiphila guanduensis]